MMEVMEKMDIKFKEELIWRYKFIYENIDYLIGPFLLYGNKQENDYVVNKRIPYELLKLGQFFLLSDEIAEFSKLVIYVERRKKDLDYVKNISISENNTDKERKIWEFFNSISNSIINQEGNKILREKKLNAMDEYYKILNYQNKMTQQKLGSKLISNYLNSKNNKWKFPFGKDNDEAKIKISNFIKIISDKKNYDEISFGILSNKEKQDIYLIFHDELAWNMTIECAVDKNVAYKTKEKRIMNRDISPCGEEVYLVESNIFINPKEKFYDYYQVCPNCGYIINVPHSILSDKIRVRIEERCLNDEREFSKQLLRSKLKSVDYRDDVLIKRRSQK